MIKNFITNLQNKSERTKNRIFWSTSALAAVLVIGFWFNSFKHQIQNISGTSLSELTSAQQSQQSAAHYLKIEGGEISNSTLSLYFSVNNDTSDILNFSGEKDIAINIGGKTYTPSLSDRHGQKFASKVLSHQQIFGIVKLENVGGDSGTITFDNLFFEQSPGTVFKESLNLELKKLSKPSEIRN